MVLPISMTVFIVAAFQLSPEWYQNWMHPEGYGILELLHLIIPLAGMVVALEMLARRWVRSHRLVLIWTILLALGCLYIAGEEHSWGQHFLHWETPQYWEKINRQNETNLHNVAHLFGKTPKLILEILIAVGGLLIPFATLFKPTIHQLPFALFLPASVMVPTAFLVVVTKIWDVLSKQDILPALATRTSEVEETFIYLFIFYYIIIFRRRVIELEN
ncbi:MAG: hypothetical protein JXQ99_22545 [Hyphomicrobiaceae bacterium]